MATPHPVTGHRNGTRPHVALVVDSDSFGGAEVYSQRLLRWASPQVRCSLLVSEPVAAQFIDHLRGGELDDVALEAASDALMSILSRLGSSAE